MNFLTTTLHWYNLETSPFNTKKVRKTIKKRGRAVIFWCRMSGAYYLNSFRIHEIEACVERFEEA